MRHFLASVFLLAAASVWAQPWGPFTVSDESGVRNPKILLRNRDDTTDVFYQVSDTIFHTVIRAESGTILRGPDIFPFEGTGWSRRLYDVSSTNDGWVALVYETSQHWHRTVAFLGLDTLFTRAVIDSDFLWHGNMYENASRNSVLTVSPRYPHGFFTTWFREENFYNGQFACATSASIVAAFAASDSMSFRMYISNGWAGTGQTIFMESSAADSSFLFTSNIYALNICTMRWNGVYSTEFPSCEYFGWPASIAGRLFMRGQSMLLVSRSFGSTPARLLLIENFSACNEIQTFTDEPIAGASDRDWGLAWLAWHGPGILLYRADTTGAEYLAPGVVHWPETTVIHEAAIAVNREGRITAVWTEGAAGSAEANALRLKSFHWDTPLSASDRDFLLPPSSFILSAFPNPFNPITHLSFDLPHSGKIKLQMFDLLGRETARLIDETREAGTHRAVWNAQAQPSGIYFARLTSPDGIRTIKLCLTK